MTRLSYVVNDNGTPLEFSSYPAVVDYVRENGGTFETKYEEVPEEKTSFEFKNYTKPVARKAN